MAKRISITVPGTIGSQTMTAAQHTAAVAEVGRKWARMYGGYTATPAAGGWIDDGGQLVAESVTVISADTDDNAAAVMLPLCKAYAAQIRNQYGQTCVKLDIQTIDGDTFYI